MAWLTQEDARTFTRLPQEPDMETLTYWVQRLEPIIRAEGEQEIIVVFANRCGVEGDTVYAGTSAVLGVQNGEVSVYGLLGRGSKELLVVNTDMPPFAKLVSRPDGPRDADEQLSVSDGMSDPGVASVRDGAKLPSQKSPDRAGPPSRDHGAATDDGSGYGYDRHAGNDYFNAPNYASARDMPARQGSILPHHNRTSQKTASVRDGRQDQYQYSPKEVKSSRRTASPREGYSPKESPVFRRAASTRDGYSPRFPSPREEFAPRKASPRDGYFPSGTSSREGYSPKLPSDQRGHPPKIPSPRDVYGSREPSPREWYRSAEIHAAGASHTAPSGRTQIPVDGREWPDEGLADLASPTFPEPTPMSIRPKLAIATGPETLPPVPNKAPPRGVQPGNFFSSRDLCTPPETPFDDEPQPFTQQHWVPPSSYMYTPEEPEWPECVTGAEGRGQLHGRRPSLGNGPNKGDFARAAAARSVPTRPASRTQEVKLSDLSDTWQNHRNDQDVLSRRPSKSRNSSRVRAPERRPTPGVPDRRPTPAVSERSAPRLKSKRSEPAAKPTISASRDATNRANGTGREDRQTETSVLPASVQNLRETAFPWNSITIAASPSVFKTEFQRAETFPRSDSHKHQPQSARGWDAARTRSEGDRLRRSKSISAFQHDPTDYLPSPALPVHKAYQDMIYSAIEPATSVDSMWAAAAAAAAPAERHGSVSSERAAALPLGRLVRPDILSPMSV